MTLRGVLLAGLAMSVSVGAAAQYQWLDSNGRHVFSDRPPPPNVPARNIVRQPDSLARSGALPAAPLPRPATAASAEPADPDKALAAQAVERHKADAQRMAAQRADNCKRAQRHRASLDSGLRVARINDQGEREFLDDASRAAERQRAESIIQQDCR